MNFLDTNILFYSLKDPEVERKAFIAQEILSQDNLVFSVQVFQEFYVQATHKRRADPLTHEEATSLISAFSSHRVIQNTYPLLQEAFFIKSRYITSLWDAIIIAAANQAKCKTLYTEDLNHGQNYGGVTVINPFREE